MMSNERKNTADFHPWDSVEGLGWSLAQQPKRVVRKMGGYSEPNRLGRGRISLVADIYRRYNRNSSSVISGADFPLVNFFSQTSLQSHDGGKGLSQYTPLGMDRLHRMVDISPYKPHIGIKRELIGDNMRRSAISLTANENLSAFIYPSKPSGKNSIVASNTNVLSRMSHSSYMQSYISEQSIVRRRTGGIDEKSSFVRVITSDMPTSYAVSQKLDRFSSSILAQTPSEKRDYTAANAEGRYTPIKNVGMVTRIPFANISRSIVPSLERFPEPPFAYGNSLISKDTTTSGGHLTGLVQRVVDRQSRKGFIVNPAFESTIARFAPVGHFYPDSKMAPMANVVSGVHSISPKAESSSETIAWQEQNLPEAPQSGNNRSQSFVQRAISRQNSVLSRNHYEPGDNNVFKGEYFASPLVTVNRKFSLSSGNRFEGLGLGRKIAGRTVGTLSQQGFAADFIPESAIARYAPLADADSGTPAISPKAESSSEIITRQEQNSLEAPQSGNNRSQSSVQRAISRQNSVLSRNHYEPGDNNVFKGEYFASPLVTVNRKFSLSSGNRFEGLGLGRKIAGRTVGTLSQQGFAADFIPESAIARYAPLKHYYPGSKTAPMADAVSGVSVISPKAESSSEIIARQEQNSPEAPQPENNRSQSSVQRAISRQNNVLSQNYYEPRDNNVFKGGPAQFAGNELRTGHIPDFASPLVTINRKFSLSSGNRFEGLGLGRKIAGRTVGTLSQQGFAADFIPESAIARYAPLEHYYPGSKTAPMVDAVSGVSVISPKAESSSEIIARQEQISSETAQFGSNRSQSSLQQAVERQNGIHVDGPTQHGMWGMRLDLKTALPNIEAGSKQHESLRRSTNSVSRYAENSRFGTADSLLMRSVDSSPIKIKPMAQMLLGRQIQNTVSRKDSHGQRDLTVRHVESGDFSPDRATLLSTVAGNLTHGTIQPAAIEHDKFFNGGRAIDSVLRLPLALHSSVQHKTAVSGDRSTAGDVSAYLQRQDVSNVSSETTLAASTQKVEAPSFQASKSGSNSLSPDDIVDKVWRKLMRKLVSEQERMGGSNRWA